jgi:flagellar FliL protein
VSGLIKQLSGLLIGLLLVSVSPAWAEGDGEAAVAERAIYIPIKPAFVVNYGGAGRLKYLKAEVSVRVRGSSAANSIRHHMPYIRNNLILLFSSQMEENLDNQEGKELLRQAALQEITNILVAEEGVSDVEDLYFNQLVIQR